MRCELTSELKLWAYLLLTRKQHSTRLEVSEIGFEEPALIIRWIDSSFQVRVWNAQAEIASAGKLLLIAPTSSI